MSDLIQPSPWYLKVREEFRLRRRVLHKAYLSLGITKVIWTFIGGGDDGEIDESRYYDRDGNKVTPGDNLSLPEIKPTWDRRTERSDPLPRVAYVPLYQIESAMGFGLMELCDDSGWWNDSGGRATVEWNLIDDVFDLEVVDYIMTEGPARRTKVVNNTIKVLDSPPAIRHDF